MEIVTIKADQKQGHRCYAENLKVAPYPPIREPAMPHPTAAEGTQVMTVDEGSQSQTPIVYQSSLGGEFDIDQRDDTPDKGPKPIEELVQLQLRPKPGQRMRLNRDLSNHEHRRLADVLHKNADLFAWQPFDMSGIHLSIMADVHWLHRSE